MKKIYYLVLMIITTLISCGGKNGTYKDGVFYPNDESIAGSKRITKSDGHDFIIFYNRDGTRQEGDGLHCTDCDKCKQLEKEGYYEHKFIFVKDENGKVSKEHDPNCPVCKDWNEQ